MRLCLPFFFIYCTSFLRPRSDMSPEEFSWWEGVLRLPFVVVSFFFTTSRWLSKSLLSLFRRSQDICLSSLCMLSCRIQDNRLSFWACCHPELLVIHFGSWSSYFVWWERSSLTLFLSHSTSLLRTPHILSFGRIKTRIRRPKSRINRSQSHFQSILKLSLHFPWFIHWNWTLSDLDWPRFRSLPLIFQV